MSLSQRIDAARTLIRETLASEGPSAPAACITCSFQAEGMVVTHLVRQELPDIPVLFLDTGYHFPETYAYRDRMAAAWNLNLINLYPRQSVAEQEAGLGILYRTAPDRCCKLRKVEPLFAALEAYDVWLTGLRREQSPSRAELQPDGRRKAFWSTREVWAYLKEFDIPILPLYDQGYTSIGCEPCTSLPVSVDDLRSGRSGGRKLECGIHLSAVPAE